jgi:hypothetical protein
MTNPHSQDLSVDAVNLRVYYAVAFELSSMYIDVSQNHIMWGVDLIDKISSERDNVESKIERIRHHADSAQRQIRNAALELRIIKLCPQTMLMES